MAVASEKVLWRVPNYSLHLSPKWLCFIKSSLGSSANCGLHTFISQPPLLGIIRILLRPPQLFAIDYILLFTLIIGWSHLCGAMFDGSMAAIFDLIFQQCLNGTNLRCLWKRDNFSFSFNQKRKHLFFSHRNDMMMFSLGKNGRLKRFVSRWSLFPLRGSRLKSRRSFYHVAPGWKIASSEPLIRVG